MQRVLKPKQCVSPLNRHDYGSHSSNLANSDSSCSSLPAHPLTLCCVCCSRATLGLTMVSFLIVTVSFLFPMCRVHASISNTKGHYCWSHVHQSKCPPPYPTWSCGDWRLASAPGWAQSLMPQGWGCTNRQAQTNQFNHSPRKDIIQES